jgi:hypothetical protein
MKNQNDTDFLVNKNKKLTATLKLMWTTINEQNKNIRKSELLSS